MTPTQAGSASTDGGDGDLSTPGSEHPDRSGPSDRKDTSLADPRPGGPWQLSLGGLQECLWKGQGGDP